MLVGSWIPGSLDCGSATLMMATPPSRALLENKWANGRMVGGTSVAHLSDFTLATTIKIMTVAKWIVWPKRSTLARSCESYKAGMRGPFSRISIKWQRASGEKFRLDPIGWFREIPGNLSTASSLEVGGQLTHLHTNYRQVSNANIPSVAATNNICHTETG